MWSGGLPRKYELPRSASFGLTWFRDGVGAMEGKLFADKVSKFARCLLHLLLLIRRYLLGNVLLMTFFP